MCSISGKISFFSKEVGDKKNIEPDDEEESEKECEEEEKEEITLSKALEMPDKLEMSCLRIRIHDAHPKSQVSEIADKIMNYITKNFQQLSIISYFNKPVSLSQ